MERSKVGLILAGGAARGAYEVGVVQYIAEEISRAIGRPVPFDVLCGTSVGAINACALAALADQPARGLDQLFSRWVGLRMQDILAFDLADLVALLRSFSGPVPSRPTSGGIFSPSRLRRFLESAIPFSRIGEVLRRGHVSALSVSATHASSGRTVVFVERRDPGLPPWSSDPTILPLRAQLRVEHALASAALPIVFPPVFLDGRYYIDGGVRQNVPLSPARRLGADALVVINPRHITPAGEVGPVPEPIPSPITLLGKVFNAFLLDRIDNDINRVERINRMLTAGARRYGDEFIDDLNLAMGMPSRASLRPLRTVLIRASQDIGRLCGEFVHSRLFEQRAGLVLTKVLRSLAQADTHREADLLSYLLFDGEFARQLIELGRADARARHEELCAFFEESFSRA
jgi:NTE family protein